MSGGADEPASEASGQKARELLQAQPLDPGKLGSLTAIDLRGSGLTSLPEPALSACLGVKRLDLGGCRLERFPDAISGLPQLEVVFASDMAFDRVPPVLARCQKLHMVGLKDNSISALDGSCLPAGLIWLIAAGNPIRELPNIGRLQHVRKLMLSHCHLTCDALAPIANIAGLEMLRVAANRLESFPDKLLHHKRLAWVAVGGNPFTEAALEQRLASAPKLVDFAEVALGERLGSGAGATVYRGEWHGQRVAVKIWEAERFSDGTARGEWAVNRVVASPGHKALVGILGSFEHPRPGMLLELLEGASAGCSPPSFATVTRDALPGDGGRGPRFTASAALSVAESVASAATYLHGCGVVHGDIYLHNTLVVQVAPPGAGGQAEPVEVEDVRLSDFGAAAVVPDGKVGEGMRRLEVRSFGWLLQDLVDILSNSSKRPEKAQIDDEIVALLRQVRERCGSEDVGDLPSFADVAASLASGRAKKRRTTGDARSKI